MTTENKRYLERINSSSSSETEYEADSWATKDHYQALIQDERHLKIFKSNNTHVETQDENSLKEELGNGSNVILQGIQSYDIGISRQLRSRVATKDWKLSRPENIEAELISTSIGRKENNPIPMRTEMFEALKNKDEEKVKEIISAHAIEEIDFTAFLVCVIENDAASCIRILIENGAKVSSKDSEMLTPLHYAAFKGSEDVVNAILEHCSVEDVNIVGPNGVTPLYEAAGKNRTSIVEKLLNKGADPGYVNDAQYGRTPFHMACRYAKDTKTLKILLDYKPEIVSISDKQGALPSAVLAESNLSLAVEVAKYLKSKLQYERYLEFWLSGMDPIGTFDETLIKELSTGAYGDFLTFFLNSQKESWSKFVVNKINKEDMRFMEFLVKHNLLKKAVYDILPEIISNLFKADDTGCGIWQFHECKTVVERKALLERVMLDLGHTNVLIPFGDTDNTNGSLTQCVREKSLILWSCFSGRYNLVKLLLRASCYDIIPLGILSCQVIQHLLKCEEFPSESIAILQNCATFCQRTAHDALQITGIQCGTFYDKVLVQQHLKCQLARFSKLCLFNMAVKAQCSQVLSLTSSRQIIKERWYGVLTPFPIWFICLIAVMSHPCFFPLNIIGWLIVRRKGRRAWRDIISIKSGCSKIRQVNFEFDEDADEEFGQEYFYKRYKLYHDRPWTATDMKFVQFVKCLLRTPFVKFAQHVLMHICFLVAIIVVILKELHAEPSFVEIICFIYVLSYGLEELKQIAKSHRKDQLPNYLKDRWNWCDVVALVMFFIGFVCRILFLYTFSYFPSSANVQPGVLFWTRFFYSLSMCLFSMRLLFVYTIHDALGTKLKMINRMITRDLLPFLPILLFFVVPYGIAAQSLLYPNGFAINSSNQMDNSDALMNIVSFSFFAMVGDFQLDNLRGKDCAEGPCPLALGSKLVVYIFLVVYILVTNVLLMNLLIALFSKTAEQTDEEEMYLSVTLIDRMAILEEFKSKSFLAPPFNILQILVEVSYFLTRRSKKSKPTCQENSNSFSGNEMDFMILQAAALCGQRDSLGLMEDSMEQKTEQICERIQDELSDKMNFRFGEMDAKLLKIVQVQEELLLKFNRIMPNNQ